MLPLTLSSVRRLPPPLRLRLHVAYARAWEALTDTHQTQAVMFVRRLSERLPLEDALQRYFRQVAVPVAMQETVRARALLSLADSVPAAGQPSDSVDPWHSLRPDRIVDAVRRRAQWVEETTLQARMAACLAEAAVTSTHTPMAVEVAELLAEAVPADEALIAYVRAFDLPVKEGDTVFRAALAELADRRLPAGQRPRLHVAAEPAPAREPAAVREPAPAPAAALPAAAFGLRVLV
ncbi:MAG TPA: hypothetical protein VN719_02940 [Gemmatimonadales bacterium]|nr:hypothetical protein [Gemmatimonadales bacterium]